MCQEENASKMDGLDKHKKALGERIKLSRGDLSQASFALLLKISVPALQRYEYGERMPRGPVLEKISEVTGRTVEWFLSGSEGIVDFVHETPVAYGLDNESKMIMDMLKEMNKEQKRQALRFIEGQKLLAEREKKLKEG
jgi:transcriptional regulator with XRE-family HTH domain